ncbi:DNA polymerase I [Eubacteriales bacterium OttesenSCG-928-N14]|nr:DNA polymerase I [Eubacteriales bacterium OttesenSCG-928-N14]
MPQKVVAIDGNSLMHRAFHALPLLTNDDGEYTNAVYGFVNMLIRVLNEQQPDYVLVAFDMPGKTFRHKQYEDYKATRSQTPEELRPQFDLLRQALDAMGIAHIGREGYEADDILGYTAKISAEDGVDALLVTGDKDSLQLVGEHSKVLLTRRGITETELMDRQAVIDMMGVPPEHVPDLKGLMGDSSDNIPGVPGIGPKTATELLGKFTTLEGVLEHADEAGGKKRVESLHTYAEQARMSKELATINPDIPEGFGWEDIAFTFLQAQDLVPTFTRLGFASILKRLGAEVAKEEQSEAPSARLVEIAATELKDEAQIAAVLQNKPAVFALYIGEEAISFAVQEGEEYRIPVAKTLLLDGMDYRQILLALGDVLSDAAVDKVVFDAKALCHELAAFDLQLTGNVDDVMLAGYSLNAAQGQYSLQKFCEHNGILTEAQTAGAGAMLPLMRLMKTAIARDDLQQIYDGLELPLWRVLFDMEQLGFELDIAFLKQLSGEYATRIGQMEQKIYELAGETFNINSTKQLGNVLFEKLGLPAIKKTKTGYSTDIEVLEQLQEDHPIINEIIEYRKAAKLKSTYLDGLLAVADENGRVHTRFTQNVTATGRISSLEPNLQNIPVRTDEGREIRRAFVASAPDRLLVASDYSQIELRLLAHLSGDENLQRIFLEGGDIHTATAAEVFGVPVDFVTAQMRSAAKAVNFGIIYGISDFGLARNLRIDRKEAGEYIKTYLARYPGVERYMQRSVADAKRKGYVSTIMGRRRYMPELSSPNHNTRNFGQRVAMNAPLQGSAADIIKLAMIYVYDWLNETKLDGKLILQVHDELIVDCHASIAEDVMAKVKELMEGVVQLSVPLIADAKCGKTWLDAK